MDLNYNTMDLGYQFSQKNSRSVSENPDLVREKIFKEIDLANFPPLPILLIMSMASSMPEYLTVQNSGSMKSLTEYWVGYERLWISRKSPFFFLRFSTGKDI
jgi:hypothetical protein